MSFRTWLQQRMFAPRTPGRQPGLPNAVTPSPPGNPGPRLRDAVTHRPWTLAGQLALGWLTLGAVAGCRNTTLPTAPVEESGLKRIVLLSNSNTPFWFGCESGLLAAEKDLALKEAGFHAVMVADDGTPEGQLDMLRRVARYPDIAAVALSPILVTDSRVAEQMQALKEKGVQVITVDSDVDRDAWRDARVAFIGTDNLAAGRELGHAAKALRPEGGEYAAFAGRTRAQNAEDRVKGFAEGAGDKFKSVGFLADGHDLAKAHENVRKAIKEHPELHTLVGIWSPNGPVIADVVKELDRKKDFTVVAFDADPRAIDQQADGLIDIMVVQDPYQIGYQAVSLMKALVGKDQDTIKKMLPKLGQKDGDIYTTDVKVVIPDKGSPLTADLFDKRTELMKQSDFRQWLDKNHLWGS